ncbi:hypothetical protein HUJ04_012931 [Dendroctonus ponderosae]|nr:hypothetical protein HUJ04_012931 [Dendroctonus ponderosae]KAH1006843.1 hypothetical protein HUJ05_007537 [Dendroctonus ponderosae]
MWKLPKGDDDSSNTNEEITPAQINLKKEQGNDDIESAHKQYKLIRYLFNTRWNNTFYMIE